ncbi:hypothetical protein GCG54_00000230 [Colletotrichum gloeosporioides]|uniref:Uncharacterized protein n=1 Tax=Colletotrichum gloeosporioides TaxID=474922 RepID=A0A8H4FHV7_COLGL|nr:uncharacterized protein GCG54_00000230 [Colletotrichum gloeosporioides]KAF3802863.1 hypothetical protein GCG54_00000230 [Colletotrichum gloeosporioides]
MRLADFLPLPERPRTLMIHIEHGGIRASRIEPENRPSADSPEAAMNSLGAREEHPFLRDTDTSNFLLQSKVTRMFETTQMQPALSELPLLQACAGLNCYKSQR